MFEIIKNVLILLFASLISFIVIYVAFDFSRGLLGVIYDSELNSLLIPNWILFVILVISVINLILKLRQYKELSKDLRAFREERDKLLEQHLSEFSNFPETNQSGKPLYNRNSSYAYILNILSSLRHQSNLDFEKKVERTKYSIYINAGIVFIIMSFFGSNIYDYYKNPIEKNRLGLYSAQEWDAYYYEDLDCRDPEGNDIFSGECETTSLEGSKIIRNFDDYGVIYCSIHRYRNLYNYSDEPGMGLIDYYSYPCWSLVPSNGYFLANRDERATLILENFIGYLSQSGEISVERESWDSKPTW